MMVQYKTNDDGSTDRKVLDSFSVRTISGMALVKAETLLRVIESRANCYTNEVASFKSFMEQHDPMFAMERFGRSLAHATGYSSVYSRILQALKVDEFKALSHGEKLDTAANMLENLKTVIGNIREYFVDGILRSSSASSTNQISNILDDAKRDGVLEALRDMRSL